MKKFYIGMFSFILTYFVLLSSKPPVLVSKTFSGLKCATYSNEPLLEYSLPNNQLKTEFTKDYLKTNLCIMNQGIYDEHYLSKNK